MGNKILSISSLLHFVHFKIKILFFRLFNNVYTIMLFKILNNIIVCSLYIFIFQI